MVEMMTTVPARLRTVICKTWIQLDRWQRQIRRTRADNPNERDYRDPRNVPDRVVGWH